MKKILIFLFLIVTLFTTNITISANEVTFQNKITDTSPIDEDLKIIGLDIEDFYKPSNYSYDKWYIVGLSEAYVDNYVQTYFYLYNMSGVNFSKIEIDYFLNDISYTYELNILDYDAEHYLIKTKGFTYDYISKAQIKVENIITTYQYEDDINSGNIIEETKIDKSNFEATLNHSKDNDSISLNLNYNSTLIIDNYKVVQVEVFQDDNFLNNWNSFWTCSNASLLLYFYNFDFPDRIKPDNIEYAKFEYDYLKYYEMICLDSTDFTPSEYYSEYNIKELVNKETVIKEYDDTIKELSVNSHSQTLTFPNFYLGNRVQDGQFGNLNLSGELDSFSYDCSILLDATYKEWDRNYHTVKPLHNVPCNDIYYTTLDKVNIIELHYTINDQVYKAQVVSGPVDNDDFDDVVAEPPTNTNEISFFQKLLIDIADFMLKLVGINPGIVPNVIKYAISSVALVLLLILIIVLFPTLITIASAIINASFFIIKKIIQIITAPFRLFKRN